MQSARDLKEYRRELSRALDDAFLRKTLDAFARAYRENREKAFAEMDEKGLIADIAEAKDGAAARLDELYARFKDKAEAAGAVVHLASTADEANAIIAAIAAEHGAKKIIKSKSMTAEETHLNHALEAAGCTVTETDLGEWIIQLRREGPSHMVLPAIHLSRKQVADLFTEVTHKAQTTEIGKLVKVARRELRRVFAEAEMGVSGANFCIAETGSIGLVTNEGNARLVATLPPVHVVLAGLDKLLPTLDDALRVLDVLPRNATGQAITSYVTWITGATPCAAGPDGRKEMHIVLLDNGRSELAKDPVFGQALRCVRCGACANVCPVYRLVGGHGMGHIYIGAIGLILTYFFHGADKAKNLVQNCVGCGACKEICAGGIDLPRLIKAIHARIQDQEGRPLASALLGKVLGSRSLFHALLRTARAVQRPATKGGYLRHLPLIFDKSQQFRALPALADKPFRDQWPELRDEMRPAPRPEGPKIGLFSGCVQDFVYPEQLAAVLEVVDGRCREVVFPMAQSCCGLPAVMMGETRAAHDVAAQNVAAFADQECDYIVTACASCASHLTHGYAALLGEDPEWAEAYRRFAAKVVDFSSFCHDVLDIGPDDFARQGPATAYHAPCHLCRELDVHTAPRALLARAGLDYRPTPEEETCCGFGGTFSMKFPELSEATLARKLDNVASGKAECLATDCPGCVMQLRGGARERGEAIEVLHIAELLARQREKK